jgi:lysozyme
MRKAALLAVALTVLLLLIVPMSASAERVQTAGGSGCAKLYTVKPGDTLSKIARAYGTTVSYLATLNGIANPNQIAAGTTICVKAQGSQPSGFYYTVKRGDTLYSIARKYGTTPACLAQVNNIPNPDELYAGRVLWIPVH